MIVFHVIATTTISGYVVKELGGKRVSWQETHYMDENRLAKQRPDRFAMLKADGASEVRVAVEEKMGGPQGTFSSTSVRIEISVRCDQKEAEIRAAHRLLFEEAKSATEHYMPSLIQALEDHAERKG